MLAIINAELVMRDHLIPEAVLFVEDGKIAGYGEMRSTPIPEGCDILDAEGRYVGPGLVDIHTHTGGEYRLWQHPIPGAQYHLEHGITSLLPTSYPRMTREEYIQMGANIREAMAQPGGENIAGMYMEGPYINPKYGSNRAANPWNNKAILAEDFEPIIDACKDNALVWGLGPEQENVIDFVKAAKKANPEVRFAVTHSEATPSRSKLSSPTAFASAPTTPMPPAPSSTIPNAGASAWMRRSTSMTPSMQRSFPTAAAST